MKSTAGRRGIGLAAAGVLVASGGLAAGTASAATVIGAPMVSAPPVIWYTNTAYAFTFAEGAGATAVSFEYSINGGSLKSVPAVSGSAQVNLEFSGSYNTLDVYAVAADGTVSAADASTVQPPDNNVWAADDDINGDGLPDLLTAGGAGTGLPSGIWQALGTGNGRLHAPATNLVGTITNSPASYFDGAQLVPGHFGQQGFEDVLAYIPSKGLALKYIGSGNGSALYGPSGTVEVSNWLADPITGDTPLQVTNGYDATGLGNRQDGLFSIAGDATHGYALGYDEGYAVGFSPIQLSGQKTPDGTADWNDWKIAGASVQSGIALYLWNQSTGALYLWEGIKVTDNGDGTGTMTYTQYQVSKHWQKGASLTTLEAADFAGSVTPGLWAVDSNAVAKAYVVSDLSTSHTAKIKVVASAGLS